MFYKFVLGVVALSVLCFEGALASSGSFHVDQKAQDSANILLAMADNILSGKVKIVDHYGTFGEKIEISLHFTGEPDFDLAGSLEKANEDSRTQSNYQVVSDVDLTDFLGKIESAKDTGFNPIGFSYYEKFLGGHSVSVYKALLGR